MNPFMTEFTLFGSRQQTVKCTITNNNVVSEEIARGQMIKYLGAWLDQHLSFKDHITIKCKSAMLNVL